MFNPEIHPGNIAPAVQRGILEAAQRSDWTQKPVEISREAIIGVEDLTLRAIREGLLFGEYAFKASGIRYPLITGDRIKTMVKHQEDDYFGEFQGYVLVPEEIGGFEGFEDVDGYNIWKWSASPEYIPRLGLVMNGVMLQKSTHEPDAEARTATDAVIVFSHNITSMTRVLS